MGVNRNLGCRSLIHSIVTIAIEVLSCLYWFRFDLFRIGEHVKPLTKGKMSAFSGPVERIFSPAHVTMLFSQKNDIREDIIKDKVTKEINVALF